jgi:hypothetical protein
MMNISVGGEIGSILWKEARTQKPSANRKSTNQLALFLLIKKPHIVHILLYRRKFVSSEQKIKDLMRIIFDFF